jgi:hypothetical protein
MSEPRFWIPEEGDVTVTALTTAESSEIDLTAFAGKKILISCRKDFAISAKQGTGITTSKAEHPPGVYPYWVRPGVNTLQARAVSEACNLCIWEEKGAV